jgi:hypothetical protein
LEEKLVVANPSMLNIADKSNWGFTKGSRTLAVS